MKKLVIVESFTKTTTIKKYLNDKNVIVTYSSGHIYNLPKDKLGFDTKRLQTARWLNHLYFIDDFGKEQKFKKFVSQKYNLNFT